MVVYVQNTSCFCLWSFHFLLLLSAKTAGQSIISPIRELSFPIDGVVQTLRVHFEQDDLVQLAEEFCSRHTVGTFEYDCISVVFFNLQNLEFEYLKECNAQSIDCTKTMPPPSSQVLAANQQRWETLKTKWESSKNMLDPHHYRGYVGPAQSYGEHGMSHIGLVARSGLLEYHRFLDIGCGSLRLGRMLIPFLNRGSYFCFEPNAWLYQAALRYELSPHIVHLKAPTFIDWVTDFKLPEEYGQMDILFANSIFSHTAQDLLSTALSNLAGAMHDGSVLLASFFVDGLSKMGDNIWCPRYDEPGLSGWLYTNPYCVRYDEHFIHQLCKQKGLELERLDWPHEHQTWYAISKFSGQGASSYVADGVGAAVNILEAKRSVSSSAIDELEVMYEQIRRKQREL
mmetsp:Transcript_24897/g.40341  ORF Transcript_24897/g.40341 Transcript_24897/m.40341 type:complete len:399 (+) Transcript_24897:87-1283(+)